MPKSILITGASGNVGSAVVRYLSAADARILKAGYRMPLNEGEVYFNFEDLTGSQPALEQTEVLFLLRPPHLSAISKYFRPLISACQAAGIGHIVFLSVQGADKSSLIPHNRIEKLIVDSGIPYTFIRPSYFMQNLTTTLQRDIQRGEIFLPAGNAPFLWVDVDDIGRAAARILFDPQPHRGKVYDITGREYFTFAQTTNALSLALGKKVNYRSPGLLWFTLRKLREGNNFGFTIVLIMLHYLARFQERPAVSDSYTELTGQQPNTLVNFINCNRSVWQ